jgi:hypothetical protein
MKTIQLAIPDSVLHEYEEFARQTRREPSSLMQEALEIYRQDKIVPSKHKASRSVLDHEPVSVGQILKPWTNRAEMLEDFFDRT